MQDSPPSYDYHGLVAQTWDLHRPDAESWSDSALFRTLIERYGQPVLDLGCATGRIVLPFLAQGIDTEGVDNSPELLALCREKAVARGLAPRLYEQSIVTLDLPRRYRTILGSSSVFQLITEEDQARQTLQRLYAHLEPGGALVLPFSFAWRAGDPLDTGWEPHFVVTRPSDGAIVRSFTREWHEPSARLWHAEQRFEVERDGVLLATEHHRRAPEGRTYTQAQAVALFAEVGFQPVEVYQGFTHEPALPDDRLFCVVGVKPTG